MATLALSTAGAALGGAFLPGISMLGATVSGAALGQAAGALAGRYIDQALFAPSGQDRVVDGPRLNDLHVLSSGSGAPIPRLYGRARLGGQVIWGPPFEEEVVRTTTGGGSTGGGKASRPSSPTTTYVDYRYYASFAVALCEGEISRIGRVWADGKELDLSDVAYRVYRGSEDQVADSLIAAHEGGDKTPAYRGLAYVVFDRLALARFGNRLPQLSFEVFLPLDGFEQKIKAITIIPGASEFGYGTDEVVRQSGGGTTYAENTHTRQGATDWSVSMDQLTASAPNLENASLVVSWFGTDLRVAHCNLQPGVERADKETVPQSWSVQGLTRTAAHVVSEVDGRPAFGGTPADHSIVSAIKDLTARGVAATFYPFILMDVPSDNGLPDPYDTGSSQPPYPWRGRLTVAPAPGLSGSPDKTAQAAADVAAFVGAAAVSDFTISGETVTYSGPVEWSYRRMVLHYAHLCRAAGGVDAFLIGSEMRGLTWVRDDLGGYPFVAALMQLADDVKSVLGSGTKVTYAADWSEYFGHQPQDGSGDVSFHLDPLWASPSIDAVGIDLYWPLADWRTTDDHLDKAAGAVSVYDLDYLRSQIVGGEGYDWFYASEADRIAQIRTDITDGAGKPWVFRYKDLVSWWSHPHFDRPGGVEGAHATAWVPQSKPIWLTEVGCPAVDLGANQPNVFVDPKSSESQLPHFSQGRRDDLMQRRYLDAVLGYYDPADEDFVDVQNPISSLYGGRMVDEKRIYLYTWDARPYPVFPSALSVWSDGANWTYGHWLTGRLGGLDLAALVARILDDYGFHGHDTTRLQGTVHGLVIDRLMTARQALQPLELAFFFDSFESGDVLKFLHRGRVEPIRTIGHDDFAEDKPGVELCSITRAQETDLPASVKLGYVNEAGDYGHDTEESRRLVTVSSRVSSAQLPLVLGHVQARTIAEQWLHDAWQTRETARFQLPPSCLALEPSDLVSLELGASEGETQETYRVTSLTSGTAIDVEARSIVPEVFVPVSAPSRSGDDFDNTAIGPTSGYLMDLPNFRGTADAPLGWFAASQSPWPGRVGLFRSAGTSGFEAVATVTRPATIGTVVNAVGGRPSGRWDYGGALTVQLDQGTLEGLTEVGVLNGGNVIAIRHDSGAWEIAQFRHADLVGEQRYVLRQMLRGQAGTDVLADGGFSAGAPVVLLDDAVVPLPLTVDDLNLAYTWTWGPGNRSIGHYSYQTEVFGFTGQALRPVRPAHAERRDQGGDVLLQWIRRTRSGGDNWSTIEVPLEEDAEAYEVDVRDGDTVVRTIVANVPEVIYSAADQAADWGGSIPDTLEFSIYQMSSVLGRGTPLDVVI